MLCSNTSNCVLRNLSRRICSYSVAIVGSGPSGCYTAKYLPNSYKIDMIDRLPTPYGLVRYGVAPDHPEVKNVQNDFDQLQERTRLFGNVAVGQDVSVQELREMYDAVVLAYGCQSDRKLGIPGEEFKGVLSARKFVAWYNGM
jgi:adrenodoxin-NADP+ reductase